MAVREGLLPEYVGFGMKKYALFLSILVTGCGGCGEPDQFSIAPGFTPDPQVHSGLSGGSREASSVQADCVGYIASADSPDHIMNVTADLPWARVLVNGGDKDTTLVIQRPDGSIRCNDDALGSVNPAIEDMTWPAGQYKIWVGNYEQGVRSSYNLAITTNNATTADALPTPSTATINTNSMRRRSRRRSRRRRNRR